MNKKYKLERGNDAGDSKQYYKMWSTAQPEFSNTPDNSNSRSGSVAHGLIY
jgi:hypothetical protein